MNGRHTLVVGGTRGTGRVVVQALAKGKNAVSVIGRRPPSPAVPNANYWSADISNPESLAEVWNKIIRKNGKLTNLVFFQRFRGEGDAWEGEIQTSLTATREMIERFARDGGASRERAIVVIGSIACRLIAEEQPVSYHVAKAGLLQMVRFYAAALGSRGVRVNCVSPGTICKEEAKNFYLRNEELQRLYRAIIPLGRMGSSQEVAHVVEFLLSSKASYITGQNIVVDGGLSLQWHESLARKLISERPAAPRRTAARKP